MVSQAAAHASGAHTAVSRIEARETGSNSEANTCEGHLPSSDMNDRPLASSSSNCKYQKQPGKQLLGNKDCLSRRRSHRLSMLAVSNDKPSIRNDGHADLKPRLSVRSSKWTPTSSSSSRSKVSVKRSESKRGLLPKHKRAVGGVKKLTEPGMKAARKRVAVEFHKLGLPLPYASNGVLLRNPIKGMPLNTGGWCDKELWLAKRLKEQGATCECSCAAFVSAF